MQNRLRPAASLGALLAPFLALAACHNQPVVAGDTYDPEGNAAKVAKPVAPPPMIEATRAYRCDDNSLIYADFYTNNTVSLRTAKDGSVTILTATGGKPPYTGQGYSISANSAHVKFTAPGKAAQGCDA